jgi:hypothetical protein
MLFTFCLHLRVNRKGLQRWTLFTLGKHFLFSFPKIYVSFTCYKQKLDYCSEQLSYISRNNENDAIIIVRILLTSALRALFKVSQLRNYSLKKSNTSISNALNAQISVKTYCLKSLNIALRALVSISLIAIFWKTSPLASILSSLHHSNSLQVFHLLISKLKWKNILEYQNNYFWPAKQTFQM